jgi:anaerobic ribonucleoside-triphosphate reductase activating protein
MDMRIASIVPDVHVDGLGRRASLYVQGCAVRVRLPDGSTVTNCPGCQVPHMHARTGGREMTVAEVVDELDRTAPVKRLTVLGGEPTEQAMDVAQVIASLRERGWSDFIVYTGRIFEELRADIFESKSLDVVAGLISLIAMTDTLVDGPYLRTEDNHFVQYRGSSNQRVIDLAAMIAGEGVSGPIITKPEWDRPHLIVRRGKVSGASGLMDLIFDDAERARRCGEGTPDA